MFLAVMDLGSNSFKMTVAQWAPELSRKRPFLILHKERHPIQLGGSVFKTGRISSSDFRSGLRVLEKMQARLRDFSSPILRVVATSAIRDSSNGLLFVKKAHEELGLRIDVISGAEEARLIAQGLEWEHHSVGRGFLIDIGGGSAEVASFGRDWESPYRHSYKLGSVRMATQFFEDSRDKSEAAVRRHIRGVLRQTPPSNLDFVVGSAGTIQSLGQILIPSESRWMKLTDLDRWIEVHFDASKRDLQKKWKLQESRARVIVPGAVVLSEILRWLGVQQIQTTGMTLRDGVLVELVRNWQADEHEILRATKPVGRNVSERRWVKELELLAQRFQTNPAHGQHIAALSLSLFDQLQHQGLDLGRDERRYLLAAAYLHDVGRVVSEAAHHKHSAYLIRHLPLPGMTELESKKIALVALYHRKEGAPKRDPLPFGVSGVHADQVRRVSAILRLVDGLDAGHQQCIAGLTLRYSKRQSVLELEQVRSQPFDLHHFRQKASDFEATFGTRLVTFVRSTRRTSLH